MTVARTLLVSFATPANRVDIVADADVTIVTLVERLYHSARIHLDVSQADVVISLARSGDPTRAKTVHPTWTLHQAGAQDGDIIAIHPPSQFDTVIRTPKPDAEPQEAQP
jgi:hypothetical protein